MVQSFDIIQSSLKQVALDGTPIKTSVIRMDGGSIGINNATARLQVDYGSFNYDNNTGQIRFTKQDDLSSNVSIENGGVWRSSRGYSTMVSQPRIYITPQTNTLVLNVFRLITPSSSIANAGTGAMTIEMAYNNKSNVLSPTPINDGVVTLTLDTSYTQAWEKYLDEAVVGTDVTVSYDPTYTDGVKATLNGVDNLIVSEHWVDVTFSGLYGS